MQKLIFSILGAGIFYLGGAITVQYKLFPYPQILNLKIQYSKQGDSKISKNRSYILQNDLYTVYDIIPQEKQTIFCKV